MDRVKYDSFFLKPYPETPLQLLFGFWFFGNTTRREPAYEGWLSLTQGKGTLSHRAVSGKGLFRLQALAHRAFSYGLLRSNET